MPRARPVHARRRGPEEPAVEAVPLVAVGVVVLGVEVGDLRVAERERVPLVVVVRLVLGVGVVGLEQAEILLELLQRLLAGVEGLADGGDLLVLRRLGVAEDPVERIVLDIEAGGRLQTSETQQTMTLTRSGSAWVIREIGR